MITEDDLIPPHQHPPTDAKYSGPVVVLIWIAGSILTWGILWLIGKTIVGLVS
jgi:hypothetical protein